jgi:ribosomal protein L11 methyltransferase
MSGYIQLEFTPGNSETSELLLASLCVAGFEGFEEGKGWLKAYTTSENYNEAIINEIVKRFNVNYKKNIIDETNWNQLWESNFQPVIINDFVAIRADFHEPIIEVRHEIVITPKMSFGTGHHATTFMMMQQMREIDFTGNSVLDFGTGTGILSILAEKMGATRIIAVDNDDWSIKNATENLQRNNCTRVELKKTDSIAGDQQFEVVLANINKNVILDNFSLLVKQLAQGGVLLLSGLLTEDKSDMMIEASKFSLHLVKITEDNNWICLRFNH